MSAALLPLRLLPRARVARLVAMLYRALAVIILLNLHWLSPGQPALLPAGYAVILGCSALLLLLAGPHVWRAPGVPALLFAATIAAYLIIGAIPFLTGVEWQSETTKDFLRQLFFLAVFLAAALGGCVLLARVGPESFLRELLRILCASCLVILATPLLRSVGLLPWYRLPYRLTGSFTDPNDAAFIGCMTVALAAPLLRQGSRQRRLAWLGLALGYAAGWASLSNTVVYVFAALALMLLLHGPALRRSFLPWLLLPGLLALFIHPVNLLQHFGLLRARERELVCATISANPGLESDCAILLAARDILAGDVALNWDESLPIYSWRGVDLGGVPLRVKTLVFMGQGLNGSIPPQLGGLERLISLRLENNRLTGPVPPELGQLLELRELLLAGNELSGPFPPVLETIEKLSLPSFAVDAAPADAASTVRAASPAAAAPDSAQVSSDGLDLMLKGERTDYGSIGGRPGLWRLALEKSLQSPLIGNGLGTFQHLEGGLLNYMNRPAGVHNLYLRLFGEAGFAPLLLYALFLLSLLRLRLAAPPSLARETLLNLALVMALFSVVFQHLLTLGAFVFLAGIACALAARLESAGLRSRPGTPG